MLSLPFYLLLAISIVSKCATAYVLDESVSMNNEHKSQTDPGKQSTLFDGSISSSNRIARNANDADNQLRTSTLNATAIDNSIEMPQPNDEEARNTLDEVETGTVLTPSPSYHYFTLVKHYT